MAIGAVLTQAVAWRNAERAIAALRAADLLSLPAIARCTPADLVPLIRPAGYYRAKAATLVALARHVVAAGGLPALAGLPPTVARAGLLRVRGIGPETADAILCYGLGLPALVCDAYARRVLGRIGLVPPQAVGSYAAARRALLPLLPAAASAPWLGELHALLVAVGKDWCRPQRPRCATCPAAAVCACAGHAPAEPGKA